MFVRIRRFAGHSERKYRPLLATVIAMLGGFASTAASADFCETLRNSNPRAAFEILGPGANGPAGDISYRTLALNPDTNICAYTGAAQNWAMPNRAEPTGICNGSDQFGRADGCSWVTSMDYADSHGLGWLVSDGSADLSILFSGRDRRILTAACNGRVGERRALL